MYVFVCCFFFADVLLCCYVDHGGSDRLWGTFPEVLRSCHECFASTEPCSYLARFQIYSLFI